MPSFAHILVAGIALAVLMAVAWLTQRAVHNAGWIDVFWSFGTGFGGVGLSLVPHAGERAIDTRTLIVAVLAALWSIRLGLFIARRTLIRPEDARYAELRKSWGAGFQPLMFGFLQLQALVALLLAVTIALAAHRPTGFGVLDLLGVAVLLVAIGGEAIADRQLHQFTADVANRGRVCDIGLWSWSRHPNYFFEWLGWLAYPLFAITPGGGYPEGWLSLLGPLCMYGVLVYGSGIPPLEQHMLRSRGDLFRAYQRRTNAFWPGPQKAP